MKLTVLYDGDCEFCTRSARRASAWSPSIEPLPLQDPSVQRRFPEVSLQAALESMHVIREDGGVARGAQAWRWLAQRGPWPLPWLAMAYRLPGVGFVAEHIYRQVARARVRRQQHRDCVTGACLTPAADRAAELRAAQRAQTSQPGRSA